MIPRKPRRLLAALLVLFSSPVAIFAQKTTWESTIEGARKALNEHRLADAAQLFLQASKEAEQFGPEDARLAEVLDGLASVYRVYVLQHKYAQAEPVQERAVEVCEKVYGLDHFETWLAKRNLAMLYHVQGKDAKAELLLRQNVEVAEKRFGPQGAPMAERLVRLAEVYVNQGQDAQAGPLYQRALAIGKNPRGRSTPKWCWPRSTVVRQDLRRLNHSISGGWHSSTSSSSEMACFSAF